MVEKLKLVVPNRIRSTLLADRTVAYKIMAVNGIAFPTVSQAILLRTGAIAKRESTKQTGDFKELR